MNTMGISTDPALLQVELSQNLIESPSVSTFMPEEEASIYPLLSSNMNGTVTPLTFSHPLTPCIDNDNDSNISTNLCNEDGKVETSSSSGSSSGIGISVPSDIDASTTLFNKHSYKHLPNNNVIQDANGHGPNGNLPLPKDTPSFVSWNWPLIRKCTFFVFMSSLLAMCAIVVAMIVTLPKICNPKTTWYHGSVFYEIFPASFQDSDNDGLGDLRGIAKRIDYFKTLGVSAIRLNSVFNSPHYPEDFKNITSLKNIAPVLGHLDDMRQLTHMLHSHNISIILDVPLYPFIQKLGESRGDLFINNSIDGNIDNEYLTTVPPQMFITENPITESLHYWAGMGIDGFYIKGLEHIADLENLPHHLIEWKNILGADRPLIIEALVLSKLSLNQRQMVLTNVDLVDVHLDVFVGTTQLQKKLNSLMHSDMRPSNTGAWIHWSLGGVDKMRLTRNQSNVDFTLAATLMQLMLPGTCNIFYGDEIALQPAYDSLNEHGETEHLHHLAIMRWSFNDSLKFSNRETLPWLPKSPDVDFHQLQYIKKMIALRNRSPSIYKNAICKSDAVLQNTAIRRSYDDILIIERVYPRRNSFVSISNFGRKDVTMDMTSLYYSGLVMLNNSDQKIYFSDFKINAQETIIVRLDK
uniref:Glycosyl hydrolase family 13 catalytic domain-containing protein n=1 Tax=Glossina brevipalpis TaxID=37001 RepID=A0A1A9W5C9_9MUSC